MSYRFRLSVAPAAALLLSLPALAGPPTAAPPLATRPATEAAPHLHFQATTIDLGNVVRGKDATAVFTYENTGNAELKILSAKPG